LPTISSLDHYLHVRLQNRVKIDVTRLALWVSLVWLPLAAAEPELNGLLQGIEQRYNRAKTLQVQFNETYSVSGRARKSESGSLTLRKPGRMRWDYATPAGKLFLSDGRDVYVYTPDTNRVEKVKLKESEDMRAPLAFLLGKLDFAKEFRDFDLKQQGANFLLTARAKTDKLPYDRIEMLVSPEYQIRRLVVNGQDQSILTFLFEQEKLNPPVNDAQFKFKMPPGATLVKGEESQ
jgi:outer membrane lipoprotein carrier protein